MKSVNYLKAMIAHLRNGGKFLPLPLAEERLAICARCEARRGDECLMCGCSLRRRPENATINPGMPGKVFYPLQMCPAALWPARPHDGVAMTAEQVIEMLDSQHA